MGKGKHPSIACTAQERKLWPLAAPEQKTSCRHDCGPARDQPKYAQASEKYGFVVFHMSNYALPVCCRAQHRDWNASAVSDMSSVDARCRAKLISVSAHAPVPLLSRLFHHPKHLSPTFQLQADSAPVLATCGSCQHVAQEAEWTACTAQTEMD